MGRANEEDVPVDPRPLPVARLASDLYGRRVGRPAVVIGGGPSAPDQYRRVISAGYNPVVISANGHAAKLGVRPDFIVCKDHVHTETKELMEPQLRALGVPIVARHYWADYRLPSWPIQGNSGIMALGFAAMMGCAPIFPVGFDCYANGTYFHAPDAPNISVGLRESHWRNRYQRLRAKLVTADIRLLDPSPLAAGFPLHSAHAEPKQWRIPPAFDGYADVRTSYVRSKKKAPMKQNIGVIVPPGYTFPVDDEELRYYLHGDYADLVDNPG